MKISVITPTFRRQHFLPDLAKCFRAQTYPDKELLILDDSEQPSIDMQQLSAFDPEIRYIHTKNRSSIGAKRNSLIENARGDIIVQFDDDDYYSPMYLQTMAAHLKEHDFFTLSSWYAFCFKDHSFWHWDTSQGRGLHYYVCPRNETEFHTIPAWSNSGLDNNLLWGYGFSYAFRKAVFHSVQYPDMNHGEDYDFVKKLHAANFRLYTLPDIQGLVLHVIHTTNTVRICPQYHLPSHLLSVLFPHWDIESTQKAFIKSCQQIDGRA